MVKKNQRSRITIVGLGTGAPDSLTRLGWRRIHAARAIAVHSLAHRPDLFPEGTKTVLLDGDGSAGRDPSLAEELIGLAGESHEVVLAVPGAPDDWGSMVEEIRDRAGRAGVDLEKAPAVSLVEAARALVGGGRSGFSVLPADELAGRHVPPFPPSSPAYLTGVQVESDLQTLQAILLQNYPAGHELQRVSIDSGEVHPVRLDALDREPEGSPYSVWYVPPLARGAALEDFHEIVAHLRAPNGCPWDREQTHLSLRTNLLEETYETLEALDAGDVPGMVEEFGDLLLQILLHAQIAVEAGEFRMADVVQGIYDKIIRRHPHVFGDVQIHEVTGVLQNWERLKAAEREKNGENSRKKGILDGVPAVFPSLAQAQEIQDRAARVGFDWKELDGVLEKVEEELQELKTAPDREAQAAEAGDLLFAVVNLARWMEIDAESALRETNARFRGRFGYIESRARERGTAVGDLGFDEMNRLWDEAKRKSREA